ncbi:putative ankyrin repeat protein PA3287-like protein 2 [Colletotrichum chlorophyti]|uniref:Putative ankyrin repeat protein PA3287-like protein 2 n=1 Tax=Colletotrichum chlorophyti TaxID=708187 RepID=A0A1Q8S645_9PEZI|nr:putative ankyrin repeat protein PA3287-like protein 2 [Colletotrichum chlorophyti]
MSGTHLTSATAFSPSLEAIKLAASMYNAARQGNKAVLEEAILDGLPPNLTNEKGDTLLMLAAYYGHADLVKVLIQHGADPNRLNDKRQSPLAGAVFKGLDSVIEVLLEGGADPEYGSPSALQCLSMFKQEGKWKDKFEAAPGRGKAKAVPQDDSDERAPERFKA